MSLYLHTIFGDQNCTPQMYNKNNYQKQKNMKLRKNTGKLIIENRKLINRLGYELGGEKGAHTNTIERWIDDNKENGPLTTVKAIEIISEETGLTQEQILTEA